MVASEMATAVVGVLSEIAVPLLSSNQCQYRWRNLALPA
jgi:hypothetical protein